MLLLRGGKFGLGTSRCFSSLKSPVFFNESFKMPPRTDVFTLEHTNSHPNDARLSFDEAKHEYSCDGLPIKYSVTTLVDSFFEKFDPEKAVEKMMTSVNWPRPEYQFKDGRAYTKAQVLRKWDNTSLYARNRGTWMHHNIERYLNELETANDIPEMDQFLAFYEDEINAKSIVPYRTEWRIAAPELGLAGTVDFVGRLPDGTFCIMDWKRAKNLAGALTNGYGKTAKAPLEHLESCDGVKYALQVNVYKHLLETYYGIKVSQMTVATFHPNLKEFFKMDVHDLGEDVRLMLDTLTST